MISLKRVLLPTDFSAFSTPAARYAFALAEKFGAEVHVLHVREPISGGSPEFVMGLAIPSHTLESVDAAKRASERFIRESVGNSAVPTVHATDEGAPFLQIIRYAKEHDIDLIVLGTHGRTGLQHVLLGSVAERVVRKASCPVLTVRPEGHQFVMP